jgi:hypothetical protein
MQELRVEMLRQYCKREESIERGGNKRREGKGAGKLRGGN